MKLVLQRRLIGDASKWRTLCKFTQRDIPKIEEVVRILSEIDDLQWRIVSEENPMQPIARHDGRNWIT